jgi:hypothetical protein
MQPGGTVTVVLNSSMQPTTREQLQQQCRCSSMQAAAPTHLVTAIANDPGTGNFSTHIDCAWIRDLTADVAGWSPCLAVLVLSFQSLIVVLAYQ